MAAKFDPKSSTGLAGGHRRHGVTASYHDENYTLHVTIVFEIPERQPGMVADLAAEGCST